MIIVGIVGIMDFTGSRSRLWKHMRSAFRQRFPEARFEVVHCLYLPWQYRRIHGYADRLVRRFDTGGEVILLGYSLGGDIAEDIAARFKRSRVRLVVSVCAPDRFRFVSRFLTGLPAPHESAAPTISFSGQYDLVVPAPFVRSGADPNRSLLADHVFAFLYSKSVARQVASTTADAYRRLGEGASKRDSFEEVW